jgi:hypothetical protein
MSGTSGYINVPNSGNFTWQQAVATAADLPTNGNQIGDARITLDTGDAYTWTGTEWVLVSTGGGGGGGGNDSVGLVGATAPTSATEMGAVDSFGNLQALTVDPSGKLLVDITGSSTVTGTVNANIEGLTSFASSQYTIGISAVQLTPSPLTNRSSMSIKANTTSGSAMIYIGASNGVTTSTGYALFSGDSLQLDLTPAQQIWAISNMANQLIYVLEIGD